MKEQLIIYLQNKGYGKVKSKSLEFNVFYRVEQNCVETIILLDGKRGYYFSNELYESIKKEVKKLFINKGFTNVHTLSVILSDDNQRAIKIGGGDKFCWIINSTLKKLIIFENQVSDFYGLKEQFEEFFVDFDRGVILEHKYAIEEPEKTKEDRTKLSQLSVTLVIIAMNILAFILNIGMDNFLFDKGALDIVETIGDRQWYRLVTSMFLHGDSNHLIGNLLSLYVMGSIVEKKIGHIQYAVLYLASGIGGGICSIIFRIFENNLGVSIGASGAIFGIIGALLIIVIQNKGKFEHVTTGKILFLVFYSLYSGFVGSNIDNAGHVGGLATGIAIALIIWIGNCTINRVKKSLKIN